MPQILVTGGAGFIPSSLVEKLAENAENFIVIADNLITGSMDKVPLSKYNNIKFVKCDVNKYHEIGELFESFKFDFVFHYAALVGVKRTLDNPVKVLSDVEGLRHIMNLARNSGVKRIYYSSSSEVYGEPVEFPQNEHTTPLNSRLPYAIVKNLGEAFLKSYYQEYGMEYTILRFFNTFGPKQSKDFVVSKFIINALRNDNITVYGDGKQTRTFCYIDDNIKATTNAFYQNKFVNDVVNIGGEHEIKVVELAQTIIDITGSKSKIVYLPALVEGDMTRRKPDVRKMKELLQQPMKSLREGLELTLKNNQYIFEKTNPVSAVHI
jgi:nucleoside-diphosphate-sugar epimerase